MASLLRQIVAGPRARHPEAGLDLCYVTDNIIATSGPSQTYPQRAYRNPLDRLVEFLDSKHDDNWAIWEFRAEGTGYPDNLVYNRIRHYPWPDHHPPPFALIPLIMASMRNWLNGNDLEASASASASTSESAPVADDNDHKEKHLTDKVVGAWKENSRKNGRVAVVHCKAGKGRSGTVACCYLITECGWSPEQALARFTERRMRPRMGAGVSIPSQLRTVAYAERWARLGGRRYVDRAVEILEVHVWGLRDGVKLAVEGYEDQGKKIRVIHTFTKQERYVVEGDPPGGGSNGGTGSGVVSMLYDMAGYGNPNPVPQQEILDDARGGGGGGGIIAPPERTETPASLGSTKAKMGRRASKLISKVSRSSSRANAPAKPTADPDAAASSASTTTPPTAAGNGSADSSSSPTSLTSSVLSMRDKQNQVVDADDNKEGNTPSSIAAAAAGATGAKDEPGGRAVIFKPRTPVRVPNSDVNITVERRNRAPSSMGLTMVTAVAHVWFNAYFEGGGPERPGGVPDDAGVFEIPWDQMDGIKGSSRKGTRAADRIAVVWRAVGPAGPELLGEGEQGVGYPPALPERNKKAEAAVPEVGERVEEETEAPVPQMRPADWKGGSQVDPDAERRLGLRTKSPDSADISQASSIKDIGGALSKGDDEDDDLRGVRSDVDIGETAADEEAGDRGRDREPGDKALEAYAEKLPSPEGGGGGGGGGGGYKT